MKTCQIVNLSARTEVKAQILIQIRSTTTNQHKSTKDEAFVLIKIIHFPLVLTYFPNFEEINKNNTRYYLKKITS